MDRRQTYLVDAFTQTPLAGNVAGVLPDAEGLSESQMQGVARELGASETVFLFPSATADRRVRYFTPTTEVDLCGHATIAAHTHLFAEGSLTAGDYRLETNLGVLDITVESDGRVWMTQADPSVRRVGLDDDQVADALGIDVAALAVENLPIAFASAGLPFLVVPVRYFTDLQQATPVRDTVDAITDGVETVGIYAFTFDTLEAESTLHGRMWAPGAGVSEDPVTGTASGATGAYLNRFDGFDTLPDPMIFEQGHGIHRPGRVFVRIGETVQVGGYGTTVLEGTLNVPSMQSDDIVEG